MKYYYETTVDGMKTVLSEQHITNDSYVYIEDELFADDNTLYKNKQTNEYALDLKLVKIAETVFVQEEERDTYKFNQLYTFGSFVMTSANRLNKNQVIQIHNQFFTVINIVKHSDKPMELELNEIPIVTVINTYKIIKTSKETYVEETYGHFSSYKKAISSLWKLREKRDGYYYRLA